MPKDGFAGSMVATMSLSSNGECLGGDPSDPDNMDHGDAYYSEDSHHGWENPWERQEWFDDGYSKVTTFDPFGDEMFHKWYDGDGNLIEVNDPNSGLSLNPSNYPWINDDNLNDIINGYDPNNWSNPDDYLDLMQQYFENTQAATTHPHDVLNNKLPGFFNSLNGWQVPNILVTSNSSFSLQGWTVNANGDFVKGGQIAHGLTVPIRQGNGLFGTITYYSPNFSSLPACQQQEIVAHESIHTLNLNLYWSDNINDPAKFRMETEYAAYTYQMQLATLNGDLATALLCLTELNALKASNNNIAPDRYVSFNPPLPATPTPC